MSSVAVLTPESFAEHRSGLKDQQIPGKIHLSPVTSGSSGSSRYSIMFSSSIFFMGVSVGLGCVPEDEAYIPTYLEAFPPLPEKGAPGEKAGEPVPAWGSKIRPIKASVITQVRSERVVHVVHKSRNVDGTKKSNQTEMQVFHVPLEERRYKDNSQFGEGEEAKVCLDIMQRTGAHIELSLAKDQGLSIMVTGKHDSVMKARKEIVARLQTQVRWKVIGVCERKTFE